MVEGLCGPWPLVKRWLVAVLLPLGVHSAALAASFCPTHTAQIGVGVVAAPALPTGAVSVLSFGALGNGVADDTAAIQRALVSLMPGQTLVFPPGQYRHAARLVLAQNRTTVMGYGATLHATNPADQALLIQASGVRVLGLTLTAVTDVRRHAPWESRLAVWRHGEGLAPVTDIELRDNRIIDSGPAGSPGANSSSSAAIFVHNAQRFVVAGNLIRRPLSDAIHITGGSRQGLVVGNTVRESGDDMIGIVSYLNTGRADQDHPARQAADFAQRRQADLVRDLLVADNDLSSPYWGRGVSVVGGEDVTIVNNRVDASTHGAAIYVAREHSFGTFGVRNVSIASNRLTRVQTTRPAYSVLPLPQRWQRTGHGAVELVAHVFDDEALHPALRQALTVERVLVQANFIDDVATAGVRVGVDWGRPAWPGSGAQNPADAQRRFSGAPVRDVRVLGNRLSRVRGAGVSLANAADPQAALACSANAKDGVLLRDAGCGAVASAGRVPITGAAVTCSSFSR
jgi:Pectate lyase superfamily protein